MSSLPLVRPALPVLPALPPALPPLVMPELIHRVLGMGAVLIISISGGKDGQAMLRALMDAARRPDWPGAAPLCTIHAHLGRAEWKESLPHCQRISDEAGLPLVVVQRPQGDLVQEIEDRMHKLAGEGKPHWPSSEQRYCTSDQKRGPIDKVLRAPTAAAPHWPDSQNRYCTSHHKANQIDKLFRNHNLVISAEGIRAQESTDRQKKRPVSVRPSITTKRLKKLPPEEALAAWGGDGRLAFTWYPIFDWTKDEVWAACGTSQAELERRRALCQAGREEEALAGWPCHPAYVWGNERVSCAICVLASRCDITNGARRNPELYQIYVQMERESGFTFRQDLALATLFEEGAAS